MAKRIIKSDKKANAGKAGAEKGQIGLVEKSAAGGKVEKKKSAAEKRSAKVSPASAVAVKMATRIDKNGSVQKPVANGNSEKKYSFGSDKSVKTTGKKIPASGVTGKSVSKNSLKNAAQKSVTNKKNASVKATGKVLQTSGIVAKVSTKEALKDAAQNPVTNGKAQSKKVARNKASKAINAKPAKKNATSTAPSISSIKKAGLNNSSSNKSSLRDPFAEKLNTVTPSGYKDQTFFEQVFDVARQIPKGRVTSYGAIAASLGARSSSRMVGWAMNLAGSAKPKVPAHRVVNRNGMLSGKHHFATPTQMQELLEKEGIAVKDDNVVNFSKLFWDPMDL